MLLALLTVPLFVLMGKFKTLAYPALFLPFILGGVKMGTATSIQDPLGVTSGLWTQTLSAAAGTGSTNEAKITNIIARAVALGYKYVYIPASMLPYNASLVTGMAAFNAIGGRLVREGGNPSTFDLSAYGAAINGATDDTVAIQAALSAATVPRAIVAIPGSGTTKASATLVVPVGVQLALGEASITSSAFPVLSLGIYSSVMGSTPGATITATTTGAGAIIQSSTPGVQVGSCVIAQLTLVGQGSGQVGSIAIDMTGIKESQITAVAVQNIETGIKCTTGAATCYWNQFEGVLMDSLKTGYVFSAGANSNFIVGGAVRATQIPLTCNNCNGLVIDKTEFGAYTTSGPTFVASEYKAFGIWLETASIGLTTWTHDATSVGCLIHPTLAANTTELFLIGNDSFVYLRTGAQIGNPPAALGLLPGDVVVKRIRGLAGTHRLGDDTNTVANADAIWELRRSAVAREASLRWWTAGVLKWYLGAGVASSTDDLAWYNNALTATAARLEVANNRFTHFAAVMDAEIPLVSGATPAVDASQGNYFTLAITANIAVVVAVPSNQPTAGLSQEITIAIRNSSGGALTTPPTFNTGVNGFKFAGGAIVNPVNGTQVLYKWRWDILQSLWYLVAVSTAL